MKSILAEDIADMKSTQCEVQFTSEDGNIVKGWAIAKPLNYSKEYVDDAVRDAWIEEIRAGKAIAVHFTQDEIDNGEVPSLYKRAQALANQK